MFPFSDFMKVIPSHYPEGGEESEKTVYDLLEEIEPPGNWYALHSQNLSDHHRKKQWSELDFVIVGPEGILVLEVKGGEVWREDGIWHGRNRKGVVHKKKESPFDQAKDGRYALQEAIEKMGGGALLNGALIGWGAVFPDIVFDVASVEISPKQLADQRETDNASDFGNFLDELFSYWRNKIKFRPKELTRETISEIVNLIRPNFDLVPRLGYTAKRAEREFVRMTDEQYRIMDALDGVDSIICRGGAGTGKTFVAAECARREASSGHSVLFVTEGRVFSEYVSRQIDDDRVVVRHLSALPEVSEEPFDVLIVDEGQDMLHLEALDALAPLFKDGFEKGRWRWFMDFNNQSGISGKYAPAAKEILESIAEVSFPLRRNVRNVKPIATQTQLITGADIGLAENTGYGKPPVLHVTSSKEDESGYIESELGRLTGEEYVESGDIAFVSFTTFGESCCAGLPRTTRRKIHVIEDSLPSPEESANRILFAPIADFKGLERKFVFVCDLRACDSLEDRINFLYVAMTRANFGLWILIPEEMEGIVNELKAENALKLSNTN